MRTIVSSPYLILKMRIITYCAFGVEDVDHGSWSLFSLGLGFALCCFCMIFSYIEKTTWKSNIPSWSTMVSVDSFQQSHKFWTFPLWVECDFFAPNLLKIIFSNIYSESDIEHAKIKKLLNNLDKMSIQSTRSSIWSSTCYEYCLLEYIPDPMLTGF